MPPLRLDFAASPAASGAAAVTGDPRLRPLPEDVAPLLRRGALSRFEAEGVWTLYVPTAEVCIRLNLAAAPTQELGVIDLMSDDRFWQGGKLLPDLYHAARSLRAHRDAREVNLEINYACGYACRHCFQSIVPERQSTSAPARQDLLDTARSLVEQGVQEISITGGDIFLSKHVWALLDFFHEAAPQTTLRLLVNAGALNPSDPDVVRQLRRLSGRRVLFKSDFFGHSPELHDGFTGVRGSLDRLHALARVLREAELVYMPTAAITRANFEFRFELVNLLDDLSDDCFSVSTLVYPSQYRAMRALSELRLTQPQFEELLSERFFASLTAEYHAGGSQCADDCQFAVVSPNGSATGCSFMKVGPAASIATAAAGGLQGSIASWRRLALMQPSLAPCEACVARPSCRSCLSFVTRPDVESEYCGHSRLAFREVQRRVQEALARGYRFVHQTSTDGDAGGWRGE